MLLFDYEERKNAVCVFIHWIKVISKLWYNSPTNQIINSWATTDQLSHCINLLKFFKSTKLNWSTYVWLLAKSKSRKLIYVYRFGMEYHFVCIRIYLNYNALTSKGYASEKRPNSQTIRNFQYYDSKIIFYNTESLKVCISCSRRIRRASLVMSSP